MKKKKPISTPLFWHPCDGCDDNDGLDPGTAIRTFDAFLIASTAFRKAGMTVIPMYFTGGHWMRLGEAI
jgi:hypothetical protein